MLWIFSSSHAAVAARIPEEDGGHVDARQHLWEAVFLVAFHPLAVIEDFRVYPEDAEHEEHPHEGRQMGYAFENWHEQKAADSKDQHGEPLMVGHVGVLRLHRGVGRKLSLKLA